MCSYLWKNISGNKQTKQTKINQRILYNLCVNKMARIQIFPDQSWEKNQNEIKVVIPIPIMMMILNKKLSCGILLWKVQNFRNHASPLYSSLKISIHYQHKLLSWNQYAAAQDLLKNRINWNKLMRRFFSLAIW